MEQVKVIPVPLAEQGTSRVMVFGLEVKLCM